MIKNTAATEIDTELFVGSVRCVLEAGVPTFGNTLAVSYDNSTDGEVFATAFVGETQMVCKFEDTGRFNLSSMGLDTGFGGLSIQHIETNLFAGPDGLPIKTQELSAENITLSVE